MAWSWLSQISDPVAITQPHNRGLCSRSLLFDGTSHPHSILLPQSLRSAPHTHSRPGSLPSRNAACASPQNHDAVKASVPKRFGLSRCFLPLLPQLNAERSSGFLIHQLAPVSPQASGGLHRSRQSPLPGGPPLTTSKTYNTRRSSLALASSCHRLCALPGAARYCST